MLRIVIELSKRFTGNIEELSIDKEVWESVRKALWNFCGTVEGLLRKFEASVKEMTVKVPRKP